MEFRGTTRRMVGWVVVLGLLTVTMGVSGSSADAATGSLGPLRIMIVGDSISQGSAGDYTWRYRLWQHLAGVRVDFVFVGPKTDLLDPSTGQQGSHDYVDPNFGTAHDAIWGRTLAQEQGTIASEVADFQPDVLLVLMGIDDLIWLGATAEQATNSMQALVMNARSANPNVRFVLSTLLTHDPVPAHPDLPNVITQFNASLRGLATSLDSTQSPVGVTDPSTGFDPATDTYDASHPNPAGEFKIAAAFADTLASVGIGSLFGSIPTPPAWPEAPTGITATPLDGAALLSWSAVPGASAYVVYQRDLTAGETGFTRLPFAVSSTGMTAGLLQNGDTYAWEVSSLKVFDEGPPSPVAQATPTGPAPAAPTGLTATIGDRQITLGWNLSAHATGYFIFERNVSRGETAFTRLPYPVAGPPYTAVSLTNGETYAWYVQPYNGSIPGIPSATVLATPSGSPPPQPAPPPGPWVVRLAGPDRYATAVAVSRSTTGPGVDQLFVATGEDFPDALAGAAAAGSLREPMLLLPSSGVPADVVAEISRLHPSRITVLGGGGVVSDRTVAQLGGLSPIVRRLSGTDRFATSAAISTATFAAGVADVFVATGLDFPDALAGAAAAGYLRVPLLLVRSDSVPDVVRTELSRLHPSRITILGNQGVVSPAVESTLEKLAPVVRRLGGVTRYETAAAISAAVYATSSQVFLANGLTFPDALVGAPAAAAAGAPLLLAARACVPSQVDSTSGELGRLGPSQITLLGGPGVLSDAVAELTRCP